MAIELTKTESDLWDDTGPDGDDFRRDVRAREGLNGHIEIYYNDGIVADAWEACGG